MKTLRCLQKSSSRKCSCTSWIWPWSGVWTWKWRENKMLLYGPRVLRRWWIIRYCILHGKSCTSCFYFRPWSIFQRADWFRTKSCQLFFLTKWKNKQTEGEFDKVTELKIPIPKANSFTKKLCLHWVRDSRWKASHAHCGHARFRVHAIHGGYFMDFR